MNPRPPPGSVPLHRSCAACTSRGNARPIRRLDDSELPCVRSFERVSSPDKHARSSDRRITPCPIPVPLFRVARRPAAEAVHSHNWVDFRFVRETDELLTASSVNDFKLRVEG
jgi:hypothetical protein